MALRLPSLQQLSCRTRSACVPTAAGCRPALQPQTQQQQRCNYSRLESGVFAAGVAVRSALPDPDLLALIWTGRGHAGPVQCSRSRRHRGTGAGISAHRSRSSRRVVCAFSRRCRGSWSVGRAGLCGQMQALRRCGTLSRCCRRHQRAHESCCTSKHRCIGTYVC